MVVFLVWEQRVVVVVVEMAHPFDAWQIVMTMVIVCALSVSIWTTGWWCRELFGGMHIVVH